MSATPQRRFTGGLSETAGTTLLEMIAYVFILGIVINLCAQVFLSSSRLAAVEGGGAIERIETLDGMERDFRETVRECNGVVTDVAGFACDEKQAVLRLPDGERFVVFGAPEGVQRLCKRTIRVKDGRGIWNARRRIPST